MPALSHIHADDFKDILTDITQNRNPICVVFTEESLSPEDLTSYDFEKKSIYSKISELKKRYHMSYYTSVESPVEVLRKVNKHVNELSYNQVKSLKLQAGQTVIIDLNDAKDNEDRENMLIRHDNIVYSTVKKISSVNKDVIIIYTGKRSSWEMPLDQNSENLRQRRETKPGEEGQSDNVTSILSYHTNIAVYASSNSILTQTKTYSDAGKANEDKFYILKECSDGRNFTNNNTTISFCGSVNQKVVEFEFDKTENRYWFVDNIILPSMEDGKTVQMTNMMSKIYAPERFSFHCGNLELTLKHVTVDTNNNSITIFSKLVLPDFQAQFFEEDLNQTVLQFSSAYDCVGFTTGPIWSGIFVTFILALIMTFGLCMIMDIKTMDRFDDPKGKTISINVSE
jgi:V-type H+-transporting ATPase S1 subunit